jgi:hypothetical protein
VECPAGFGADLAASESVPDLSGITGTNLLAGLFFSSIGTVGFIYGKRMRSWKPMFIGLALAAYPYFIESTAALCAIGLAGSAALFWFRD